MVDPIRTSLSALARLPRDLWIAWAVTAIAFLPVFPNWARDWKIDPNYSQGFLIPLISVYLAVRALRLEPPDPARKVGASWIGPTLVLLGLAAYVVGTGGSEFFTTRSGFVLAWLGAAWWVGGPRIGRLLSVPTLFLLFSIPVPAVLYYNISVPLQTIAAMAATMALKVAGVPVARDGNTLLLPGTVLEVADACSGIRSLTVLLALGALWAYLERGRAARRALLFACAIPLAVLGNAVRVSLTCLGVYLLGPWVAEGAAHDAMGLVVFLVTLSGLFVLSRIWRTDG